jgi:hypothetical protein
MTAAHSENQLVGRSRFELVTNGLSGRCKFLNINLLAELANVG